MYNIIDNIFVYEYICEDLKFKYFCYDRACCNLKKKKWQYLFTYSTNNDSGIY